MQNKEEPSEIGWSKHSCVQGIGEEKLANTRLGCMRKLRGSMLNKETCASVRLIGVAEEVIGMM
jgi:hypothetical protein